VSTATTGKTGDRVVVDAGRCQAYGICVGFHPEVFELPPAASAATVLREQISEDDLPDVREAILACPAQAISLTTRDA
jgi:ferredoxin